MTEKGYREKVIDEVTGKLSQRSAVTQDEDVVRARATEAVDGLIDAPVQAFVPLLAENEVLTDLHRNEGSTAD